RALKLLACHLARGVEQSTRGQPRLHGPRRGEDILPREKVNGVHEALDKPQRLRRRRATAWFTMTRWGNHRQKPFTGDALNCTRLVRRGQWDGRAASVCSASVRLVEQSLDEHGVADALDADDRPGGGQPGLPGVGVERGKKTRPWMALRVIWIASPICFRSITVHVQERTARK